jgi:hypothetical protein
MKTDQKNETCLKPAPSGESASNDTNKLRKYMATLFFTQHSIAKVIIEAPSLAEAEEMAEEIESEEIDDMNTTDGELYVNSVEPIAGEDDDD